MKLIKGSPEARAWGKKMRAIRRAGKKTERQFFGPRGVFAKAGHREHLNHSKSAYRVSMPRGKWKYFHELDEAKRYADQIFRRTGSIATIEPVAVQNPGASWHEGMEHVAARHSRDARTQEEKILFKGVEVAHRDSKMTARRMGMNPKRRATKPARMRRNPLAVFGLGNPPKRVNTTVAGVVYNVCHEIKAEKTGVKKGLYRHPFSRKSGAQILALDNGDLLIHSTKQVRLWKPF